MFQNFRAVLDNENVLLALLMQRYADFEEVNRDSLRYTLSQLKLKYDDNTVETLLNAYLSLELYPEVEQAVQTLEPRMLAILSNGTIHMLETVVRNAGLASHFNEILSVDALQTYKPDPQVYQLAVSTLGVPKERILFVSSNGWDVAGSKAFGFAVGWINRQGKTAEELGVRPDYVVGNLLELAELTSSQ